MGVTGAMAGVAVRNPLWGPSSPAPSAWTVRAGKGGDFSSNTGHPASMKHTAVFSFLNTDVSLHFAFHSHSPRVFSRQKQKFL